MGDLKNKKKLDAKYCSKQDHELAYKPKRKHPYKVWNKKTKKYDTVKP